MAEKRKGRGGKGRGQGRRKSPARVVVEAAVAASPELDGRTVGGKAHAQWLIEQLNQVDPEVMEWIDRTVSEPYELPEVPKGVSDEEREQIEKRRAELQRLELQRRIAAKKCEIARRKFSKLSFEVQGWARIWFESSTKLDARKYLHDKAGHQAVRVINHVHDKPIEHNVNMDLSERFRLALEKGEQRVRDLL